MTMHSVTDRQTDRQMTIPHTDPWHHNAQHAVQSAKNQGPYAKHCRNCYFQTKIDLRRRSIYVGMHNAILTLVGHLRLN